MQELSASACSAPKYLADLYSNITVSGPIVGQPDLRVAATSYVSSSPTEGWK